MKADTIEAWDAICRLELRRPLTECELAMVPAAKVVSAMFELLKEIGSREAPTAPLLDPATEIVISKAVLSSCIHNTFVPLTVLKAPVRDTARDWAQMAFVSIMLVSEMGLDYGPLPAGLTGRSLGLAAIALEILETRSPQRLLLQRQQQMN